MEIVEGKTKRLVQWVDHYNMGISGIVLRLKLGKGQNVYKTHYDIGNHKWPDHFRHHPS